MNNIYTKYLYKFHKNNLLNGLNNINIAVTLSSEFFINEYFNILFKD